jgi:uncharacterized protein YbjT (DUF2867 family)
VIIEEVCVLGGSGFVGRHICHRLVAQGYRVTVPTRDRERAKELILLPTAEVVEADVHDPAELRRVMRGAQAVINLVGVLHDRRGRASFREAHTELVRKTVETCHANAIRRLLHMSALNADPNAPSAYLRSRAEGERIVRDSGLDYTIFRPSVIFGAGDSFLNMFARLLRMLPVVVLGSPNARFQPVFVEDVARAFAESLNRLESSGAAYELVGPRVYTLRELVQYVGELTGRRRPVIGLGERLSYWQAYAMEFSPVKLLTRDNYYSMKVDSVSSSALPFGLRPTALEAVAPSWLARRTPRARYQGFRDRSTWQP